ncbi:CLUMA_CG013385, isoform A [Clunio marinus]|uniref:CLUMA_CG013385, isoform A n=1 Tax=Clunio marinus TaxID=568069 RepID=A0A1J1INP5_9DIPT|nr:CLUMA_CG013385, isoform A [Clunio marinus]
MDFSLILWSLKRVAWPPPSEEATFHQPVEQQNAPPQQQQQISQQQSLPVQNQQVLQKNIQSTANYAPVALNQPPKAPQQQRPVSIHSFSSLQSQAPSKPLSPLPLLQTNSPQFHSPVYGSPRGWAHVDSPRSPNVNHQPKKFYNTAPIATPSFEMTNSTSSLGQPQYQTNVAPQPTHAMQDNIASQAPSAPQPSYAQPPSQQLPFQGNALRKEAPVSQEPQPIFSSQPVATSFQGGSNRRGDLRWPPTEYKQQAVEENEARRKLALGPAFRPKRANKVDYSQFFAQNALSNTYPGYRIPPTVYTTHVNE